MPLFIVIPIFFLIAVCIGLVVYWAAVATHVVRTNARIPTLRQGLAAANGDGEDGRGGVGGEGVGPRVCVIVPAHNEEDVIRDVARSLLAQDYGPLRIVFSLDRCTDGTLGRLREVVGDDPRVEILEITECPPDWAGKVNALWTAVHRSRGAAEAEVLLFVDADTVHQPECVRAAVGLMRERRVELLSLLSTLTVERWFERYIQPAVALELIRQYPLERANRVERRRAFANGQFLMMERGAYFKIGGHEPVKAELVEDIHIARLAERHGLRAGVFLADGLMHCRMYRNWEAFQRGWARIYKEAANRKPRRLRTSALRVRVVGTAMPVAALVCAAAGAVVLAGGAGVFGVEDRPLGVAALVAGVVALAVQGVVLGMIYRSAHTPLTSLVAYPVATWFTGSLLVRAARDLESAEPTVWGGRAYAREAR